MPAARSSPRQTGPPSVPGVHVLHEIGRGARSVVYRVEREGAPYAMKTLVTVDAAGSVALLREAALLACLDHPGLPRVHASGVVRGVPYTLMELVQGSTLARRGTLCLPERDVARIGAQIASALSAAHEAGLVHRDVRPASILIDPGGRARLLDFDLATRGGTHVGDQAVTGLTYTPPEQTGMLHRAVDARSDLYALGAVLFECLAGHPPFVTDDVQELAHLHLAMPAPDLRTMRLAVSQQMAAVVARLLAKDPDDRYQSAHALAVDLRRIAAGHRDLPLSTGTPVSVRKGPLTGRDAELGVLTLQWEEARAGRGGGVLVEGVTGSGKTLLAQELAHAVTEAGELVLRGAGALDAGPAGPVRAAVEQHLRDVAALGGAARAHAQDAVRAAAADHGRLLLGFSPLLDAHLPPAVVQGAGALSLADHPLAEALAAYLVELADRCGGALLHLDDAELWDELTVRVVRCLVPLLPGSRLLLLVTRRTDTGSSTQAPPSRDSLRRDVAAALTHRIVLHPLSDAAVKTLVCRRLASWAVPETLIRTLCVRSRGHALGVEEYLRALMDAGLVRPWWGTWTFDEAGVGALRLSDDVVDLMLRRVDALDRGTRQVVAVAAVMGGRFTREAVEAVVLTGSSSGAHGSHGPSAGVDVGAALVEAVAQRILEPVEGGYSFVHEGLREAALERVAEADRRRLHTRIAEALEALAEDGPAASHAVARHYLAAGAQARPERVHRAATAAGLQALVEHAHGEALRLLREADRAATVAGLTPGPRFHAALGTAAVRVGDAEAALRHLNLALDQERDPLRRAEVFALLGRVLALRWQGEPALDAARAGLTEIGRPLPERPASLVLDTLARSGVAVVSHLVPARRRAVIGEDRRRHELEQALLDVASRGAAVGMRRSLTALLGIRAARGVALLAPGPDRVRHLAASGAVAGLTRRPGHLERVRARAGALALEEGDPRLLATVEHLGALGRDVLLPPDADSGVATAGVLERCGRWLDTGDYLGLVSHLGGLDLLRGHADEAMELYRAARARARSAGVPEYLYAGFGARAAALQGRAAEASELLDPVYEAVSTSPACLGGRISLWLAATQLMVEQGETGQPFEEALAAFHSIGVRPSRVWPVQRVFWVHQAFGRLAQVAAVGEPERPACLDRASAAVRHLGSVAGGPLLRGYHSVALAALAHLSGHPDRALRVLGRAATRDRGHDAPLLDYEAARVRARAYLALGRRTDAQVHAMAAQGVATAFGWRTRARWVAEEFGTGRLPRVGAGPSHSEALSPPVVGGMVDEIGAFDVVASPPVTGEGVRDRRLEALQQVSLAAARVLEPRELCRVALDEMVRIFVAERAALFVRDSDQAGLRCYLGRDSSGNDLDGLTGHGSTLAERVWGDGEPIVVTGGEEGPVAGSSGAGSQGLRSIMVVPVRLKGDVMGVVYLDSRAVNGVFTLDDVDVLAAMANQVGTAFTTARAAQLEADMRVVQRERDLVETLHACMVEVSSSLDPEEVGRRMVASLVRTLPCDGLALLHPREDGGVLVHATVVDAGAGSAPTQVVEMPPSRILGSIMSASQPRSGVGGAELGPVAEVVGAGAWLALPMTVHGRQEGTILLARSSDRPYTQVETQIGATLVGQSMAAHANATLFKRIEELSVRDGLTGLYNRRHFFDLGGRRVARAQVVSVVMVDIDHFKGVNDAHGHLVGDEVIREVAVRLRAVLGEEDLICRFGGEEFAVLLPGQPPEQAVEKARRLHGSVRERPVQTDAGPLRITVSVGLASAGARVVGLQALLDRADEALYAAKRGGRDRVVAVQARSSRDGGGPPEGA